MGRGKRGGKLERLRVRGPTVSEFEATRAMRVRDYDGMIENNDYWVDELSEHARFGWSFATIAEHVRRVQSLTRSELHGITATHVRTDAYVRLTMRPGARASER
jgi:predicted transcriptional regulator